jgi:hypothetical protein
LGENDLSATPTPFSQTPAAPTPASTMTRTLLHIDRAACSYHDGDSIADSTFLSPLQLSHSSTFLGHVRCLLLIEEL